MGQPWITRRLMIIVLCRRDKYILHVNQSKIVFILWLMCSRFSQLVLRESRKGNRYSCLNRGDWSLDWSLDRGDWSVEVLEFMRVSFLLVSRRRLLMHLLWLMSWISVTSTLLLLTKPLIFLLLLLFPLSLIYLLIYVQVFYKILLSLFVRRGTQCLSSHEIMVGVHMKLSFELFEIYSIWSNSDITIFYMYYLEILLNTYVKSKSNSAPNSMRYYYRSSITRYPFEPRSICLNRAKSMSSYPIVCLKWVSYYSM